MSSGLYQNWLRHYDAMSGRYGSVDPLSSTVAGWFQPAYAYALNNPAQFTDRKGLDVWVEGPSGNEPAGHLSINIGDPNGDYYSWSFGMDFRFGTPYEDIEKGGEILSYFPQDPQQDMQAIIEHSMALNDDGKSWYGIDETCQGYSESWYDKLKYDFNGQEQEPPAREVKPHSWWRWPTFSTSGLFD